MTEEEQLCPRYADPFTYVIQHLNSNPYNMTKEECITHIKILRDNYKPVSDAAPVFQLKMSDGSWIDQTEESYQYNVSNGHGPVVRILYTQPSESSNRIAELESENLLLKECEQSIGELHDVALQQFKELDAERETWKARYEFSVGERSKLERSNANLQKHVYQLLTSLKVIRILAAADHAGSEIEDIIKACDESIDRFNGDNKILERTNAI